jgi:hypothetical protein
MRTSLLFAVLGFWAFTASAQDKTLTFDNASPAKSVRLLNGTTVTISTSGNLTAKCLLNGSACADVGSVSNPNAPTVTLGASNFSSAADVDGKYNAGTTLTLSPSVTNGDVCVATYNGGATDAGNWSGPIGSPFSARTVSLATASSTYNFTLTCYNSAGSATSGQVSVSTNAGGGGGGGTTADCSPGGVAVNSQMLSAGFTRSGPTMWSNLMGSANFPDYNLNNATVQHYTDGGVTYLGAAKFTYTSVQFTTPVAGWSGSRFVFDPSQISGTTGSSGYVTLSRCQGDLRYNIANQVYATDAPACKSIRGGLSIGSIDYVIVQPGQFGDASHCGLEPGTTYYLNFANINPIDGVTSGEHTCYPASTQNCGVQIKHQ